MRRATAPDRTIASMLSAFALILVSGCTITAPPSPSTVAPSATSVAAAAELTPVPGAPTGSTIGGTVACDDIDICKPVLEALDGMIPDPMSADHVLVIARGCAEGDDCLAGINAFAVLVPSRWRLGDSLTAAWTVQGVEGSLLVKPWTSGSLPEDILRVVRAAVDGR